MALLTTDLSKLPLETRERVVKHLQHEDAAKYALACIEQARAARDYNALATAKDGIGPINMVMTPYFRNMLTHLYGAKCFADPDFRKWALKKWEEFRVREKGTRIQSGWTPGMEWWKYNKQGRGER